MAVGEAQNSRQKELEEEFRRMDLVKAEKKKPRDPGFQMEIVARVYPELFDSILYKMADRVDKKMDMKTLRPFADCAIKIHQRTWDFGFNALHFYCYSKNMMPNHPNYGKVCYTTKEKRRRNAWITKDDVGHTLRHLQPKEFHFDFAYFEKYPEFGIEPFTHGKYEYKESHEEFLRTLQPRLGTKTKITFGEDIANILDILKPRELVLEQPFLIDKAFFSQDEFKPVEYLRIANYSTTDIFNGNLKKLHLRALCEQLREFEFDGEITTMPSADINKFIKVWVSGDGKLQKFCMMTPSIRDTLMIFNILNGIKHTRVPFRVLPREMKDTIAKELGPVDYTSEKFSYRLIPSRWRRRTAVVYYCASLESAISRQAAQAYFGFHAFDFYPDSLNP